MACFFGFAFFKEFWIREDVRVGTGKLLYILVFPGRKDQLPQQILEP